MSDYAAIEKEARIFTEECVTNNRIDPALFAQYDIKRGLRDKNGKGVLAGITNISRIDAFEERDGQKIPCDGKLWYRGYNVYDLIRGLRGKRYAFEGAAYLLLLGDLPNQEQLETFTACLSKCRALPTNFVRDVIMKAPSRDMMNLQLKNQRLFALLQPMLGLGMNGLALAIYWVGAALVESIALTDPAARLTMFTNVLVFSTYATYVVMSFMMLVMIFMLVPQAQVSAERINEVLDTKPHVVPGTKTEGEERGTVEFRDVSFRYPGAAADELEHISFKVRKGQTLAVIGATGSGKTTLASLIPRFYDATAGTVLVDGVDVRAYTFDALYNKLGYVTQKAVLFSGTVEDNVFFGQSAAEKTDASLQAALSLSQAAEFVDKYPEKAAHPIAQLGRNVSGGQKQRLSIARALARKPEILIFDDSFSALDYKTDAVLREGLAKQLPGTTKIIVAQRISTIRNADQILVLDRGEIAGLGTHDELMVSCPVYREIAMSQLSEEELKKGGVSK